MAHTKLMQPSTVIWMAEVRIALMRSAVGLNASIMSPKITIDSGCITPLAQAITTPSAISNFSAGVENLYSSKYDTCLGGGSLTGFSPVLSAEARKRDRTPRARGGQAGAPSPVGACAAVRALTGDEHLFGGRERGAVRRVADGRRGQRRGRFVHGGAAEARPCPPPQKKRELVRNGCAT